MVHVQIYAKQIHFLIRLPEILGVNSTSVNNRIFCLYFLKFNMTKKIERYFYFRYPHSMQMGGMSYCVVTELTSVYL